MGASTSAALQCGCWPKREAPVRSARSAGASTPSRSSSAPVGHEILKDILAIERRCLAPEPGRDRKGDLDDLEVECMLDEPKTQYFLCSSLSSPSIIAYYRLHFADVHCEDVRRALVDPDERRVRDAGSEYQVLRTSSEEDPTEDISFVLRAPWPFSDRDLLQRRWQLPLPGDRAEGVAILMRSFDDDGLLPRRADRVRAVAHRSAYLLRPDTPAGPGLEVVVCQQLDLGGLCPPWAQSFITRFAVQRSIAWGKDLRDHCIRMRGEGEPAATVDTGNPQAPEDGCESLRTPREPLRPTSGKEILREILAIEACCRGDTSPGLGDGPLRKCIRGTSAGGPQSDEGALTVECLHDEPTSKYCLCASLDTPIVIGYLRVVLPGLKPWDVWRALVQTEERLQRDPDSEYQVLREGAERDPTHEEDFYFIWRSPWPFWDREFLMRRWTFPLRNSREEEGIAVVMRSLDDESLLPLRQDRVRAHMHKCGYLLRNFSDGLELTVCQQVDLGGLCPEWAQDFLTRYTVHRALNWAEDLRQHCQRQNEARSPAKEAGIGA